MGCPRSEGGGEHSCLFVGKKAPEIECKASMPDGSFKVLKLSDFIAAGKSVLLFFYPGDFTFVCPTEIIAFDKVFNEFESRGVVVLGCSVDSVFVHDAWKKKEVKAGGIGKIAYPLLGDLTKKVSRDYGVLTEDGVSLRGLFYIDKKQILQHSLINNMPVGRSVSEALRVVDAVLFTETHGEVCPANWMKGGKTLKPTSDGVADYLNASH